MLKYSHPLLAEILDHWPSTVFVPMIALMLVALAVVTHRWDQRDESLREVANGSAHRPEASES